MNLRNVFFISLCLLASCGQATEIEFSENVPTSTLPFLSRIDPAEPQVGQSATLFGFGFSVIPQENIIHLGNEAILAESYGLVDPAQSDELEQLTFTVPADAILGAQNLTITVLEHASSNTLTVSVVP